MAGIRIASRGRDGCGRPASKCSAPFIASAWQTGASRAAARPVARLLAVTLALSGSAAHALDLAFPLGDEQIEGKLDTTITLGAAIRMQDRNVNLLGKADLNPNVCGFPNQSCQGVFRTQTYPAEALTRAPGLFSMNTDDGDLNYNKHDLVQAPAKASSKLMLHYGDFGISLRGLFFYDFVNNSFTEFHPNRITPENAGQVGRVVPRVEPTGYVEPVNQGQRVYGPGGVVRNRRKDGEILRQAGTDFQLFDSFVYGKVPVFGADVSFKLGRQVVSWGESTALVINSLNQANPVNANNLYRVGFQLDELFTPVNLLSLSTRAWDNATLEGFYQLQWKGIEAPAPGTFFSTVDIGTSNAIGFANLSFGQAADDPSGAGVPLDSPLAGITKTSSLIRRVPDLEPRSRRQFGIALKYYAEGLNNGTDLGFYYMNYHSRLPYVSFYSTQASCARREGNPGRIDANSTATFFQACPDLPSQHPGNPQAATSDALPLDTGRIQLEYPENIHMLGVSFNTTFGDYALQGEIAYRPNLPLQVSIMDLALAAAGPTLTRCHNAALRCTGTAGGSGTDANGNAMNYGSSDFVPGSGVTAYPDTFDLAVGGLDGSARSFPNFIIPYRGGVAGENAPTDLSRPFDRNNPGYIRGFERFKVYQVNLGWTRVFGATENTLGADQVIALFETGATYVQGLPSLDVLQIQGPATFTHASAGADGSGADGSRMACSTTPDCSIGPDGARFNPHQQDPSGYTTRFSWGYRLISFIRYESVLPGISIQPFVLLGHDVNGISPGPAENFIAGRKSVILQIETRYQSALSFTVGYNWFWGGGVNNLLSDRDNAQFFIKYQF